MVTCPEAEKLQTLLDAAAHIVVLQADNPDADSLATALALEEILSEMGKTVSLYCSIDMPTYLRYLSGWDRVHNEMPKDFDAAILVDASTATLLSKLGSPAFKTALVNRPFIVLDHHAIVQDAISFATVSVVDDARSSTGELVYYLGKQLGWRLPVPSLEFIMTSILGDTQGLTNSLATADTYRVMAELLDAGVERAKLEELRREASKMPETIFRYKGELIKRTELYLDDQIGVVHIPQQEINTYSPLYNPAPLIQNDLLQIVGLRICIVFKTYDNGRVTAAIRANTSAPIANTLAEKMGGGGHAFASGFKIEDGRPFNEIKSECIQAAMTLLQELPKE